MTKLKSDRLRVAFDAARRRLLASTGLAPLALAAAAMLGTHAGRAHASLPIEHWTTESGVRVYFVRAEAIPILDVNIDFDAGGRYDPATKAGLASMTAGLIGKGVPGLDENAIADRFADLGSQRGGGAGDDRASLSIRTLTSARELAGTLELFERIVSQPTFPAAVFARQKEQVVQALREAETKPESIASRAFEATLYPNHPYGLSATPASVAAITRDDVAAFWRRQYAASRAVISMIGAITRTDAERIAERLARGMPRGEEAPKLPEVALGGAGTVKRIAHPATQSHILLGAPAISRGDPDFFALMVGNYILGGGGFVSRLTAEVREKRGLAYSVYSYFSPSAQPGPFQVGLQTARAQTDTALKVVRDTLERFLTEGPTDAELRAAKDNLIGGFALRIDSNRKILDNLSTIGYYRLPLDYLDTWTANVERVSTADIRAAFARHVKLAALHTVVVGAQ